MSLPTLLISTQKNKWASTLKILWEGKEGLVKHLIIMCTSLENDSIHPHLALQNLCYRRNILHAGRI